MKEKKLPFTCPICGRTIDYSVTALTEGAVLTCPLHGHMWENVQREIKKLTKAKNT